MSSSDQAMSTLTQQWYNSVITGLGLSPDNFQLYQGAGSTANTSQEMWNMFNTVPPKSINSYFDPAQVNNFASDYNLILSALSASSSSNFQNCMGDYYSQWQSNFAKNVPSPVNAETVTKTFTDWAIVNAPGQASCASALTKIFIDPVNSANIAFAAAERKFAWNKTVETLKSNLASGPTKSFSMDSLTQSSDTTHTWAGGSTSVLFDLFSFGGGGSYDKVSNKATSAGLKIDAKFTHMTTFAAGPYSQPDDNNPILSGYQAWYVGAVMSLAYSTKDNTVWDPQKPTTWEKAFGSDGFLQRLMSSIVAVDGIEITMTSTASYSTAEQTQIKSAAKVGFWPFFSASGSGGFTNTVEFNDQGQFTCKTTSALGNPQILGVLQTPTEIAFSK